MFSHYVYEKVTSIVYSQMVLLCVLLCDPQVKGIFQSAVNGWNWSPSDVHAVF